MDRILGWFFFFLGIFLVGVAYYISEYTLQGVILRPAKVLSFYAGLIIIGLAYGEVERTFKALWRKLG